MAKRSGFLSLDHSLHSPVKQRRRQLGRRQTVLSRSNRLTDRNGDRDELLVTNGQVGNAPAGTYRDNVTVTVVSDN